MAETIKATIQLRRATEAKWNEIGSIFIPKEGEPCLTLDGENAGKVKYGDGINTWSNLLYAGRDGPDGTPGLPGQDGFSPTVQTAAIDGGTRVTITDADGPKTFDVLNGTNGEDGEPGQDGAPGQDGFSPTASVTQTEDGAKITITDKSGTTNATITNGKDGINGTDGADGQTPNITPGNIETLPAGSDVTASITGQTPNLVLNLGIPQGPAGAGVPPTDTAQAGDVPTWDGEQVVWAAQSGGGGAKPIRFLNRIETTEAVKSIEISEDSEGKTFEELGLTEVYGVIKTAENVSASYTYGTLEINNIGIRLGQNFRTSVDYRFYSFSFTLLEDGSGIVLFRDANNTINADKPIAYGIAVNDIETMGVVNFGNVIKKLSIRHADAAAEAILKAGTIILVYGR